jgi:lysophospholipase L1-like esterase
MKFAFILRSLIAAASVFIAVGRLSAQSNSLASLHWIDARNLLLEGRGWSDTKSFFDRLPAKAEGKVRTNVWNLSHDSTGMRVRFVTDATAISARWVLRKESLAMAHMPATGVSGLDLYVKFEGKWHWLANGRPLKVSNEATLVRGLEPGRREYAIYFPLYNGVEEVQIGVATNAIFESAPPPPANVKPIVFYGTSILQGGCASRPGMAYPAILGRRLDVPTINLGFSGNAWSEPELAELLAELDPSAFVLDPLPNMSPEMVKQRIESFVQTLRNARPNVPIVLVENVVYTDGQFLKVRRDKVSQANANLREIFIRLQRAGMKKLFYVEADKLLGDDGEATVDGTHPTDLGFVRMADAIEPTLRRALKTDR